MYVKALLKIFEYATNIKNENSRTNEELERYERAAQHKLERRKKLAKLNRFRSEHYLERLSTSSDEDSMLDDFENYDSNNNNSFNCGNEHLYKTAFDEYKARVSSTKHDENTEIETKSRTKANFHMADIIEPLSQGINTIIDDAVTKRFTHEELNSWNLLTRTHESGDSSLTITALWLVGFFVRYLVMCPFRILLFLIACLNTFIVTYLIGLVPEGRFKRWLNYYSSMILHCILSRVFSAIITFHNRENRATGGSICVANHTSPIDVIILSTDNTYSFIGQKQGGFTGMMQEAFSRASNHIWFDRSESKDRSLVSSRMREHANNSSNCPILIFPEGTCINNTSVMMFKKGCFEVGATIYPVAIKYDSRFGDAFWNSSRHSMLQYLFLMMTSWAIVVDVYYLPAMKRRDDEDVLEFTNRVKTAIVKTGSFDDINWDGALKRPDVCRPKLDLMYAQQKTYARRLNAS